MSQVTSNAANNSTDPHQGFFAFWSRFYERTPLLSPLLRSQQDLALARLLPKRGERILDLGTGPGRALRALEQQGCRAIGIDLSAEMLSRAREQAPVVRASASALPIKSGAFDGVVCTNSFHHYPEPLGTLREVRRVLAPGGRAVLIDPNLEHPAARLAIYGGEALLLGMGVHLHAPEEWRALCRAAGFTSVHVERLAPPLLGALLRLSGLEARLKRLPGFGALTEPAAVSLCVVAYA